MPMIFMILFIILLWTCAIIMGPLGFVVALIIGGFLSSAFGAK